MPDPTSLEETVEFSENPEPRCPCVLLLDTSGSMQGAPIAALNDGLRVFEETLARDSLASRRVEVAVVSFDSVVTVVQDFVTADRFAAPTLMAQGLTHMGEAIQTALDMVEQRKATYRANGVAYYRPWVFMITDGEPQGESPDAIETAGQRIHALDNDQRKGVAFFAVGVEGANMDRLRQLATRAPVKLLGLNFQEMFLWLSASMHAVSQSQVKDQVALPPPGWAGVT
ncbi:MAG: VWA domain-containing protein [Planctomycetes bacterium]|nr:VWA domain-containing protein [Planctomycetota bacterium]